MQSHRARRLFSFSVATVLFSGIVPALRAATVPVVESTMINSSARTITISGSGFDLYQHPTVTLDGVTLKVNSVSNNAIVAALGSVTAAGTYLLKVVDGSYTGQFDVTLGAVGPQGATGPAGSTGATGATGAPGPKGATGNSGATGAQGAPGRQGATGPMGTTGAQGTAGATGPAGAQGAPGAAGPAGSAGQTGPAGAQGAAGPQGSTGATGPAGPAGAQGPSGSGGGVVTDGNGSAVGTLLSYGYGLYLNLKSGKYFFTVGFDGSFPIGQIYWTGDNCTGTPYLNDGGGGQIGMNSYTFSIPSYAYTVTFSAVANQLYVLSEPDANSVVNSQNISGGARSIENPTCMASVGPASGWAMTPVSAAMMGFDASGTPLTVATPLRLP